MKAEQVLNICLRIYRVNLSNSMQLVIQSAIIYVLNQINLNNIDNQLDATITVY